MPCCCSFFLFDGHLTGVGFLMLWWGLFYHFPDVRKMVRFCIGGGVTGIYKIGKKVEFLPKLYFFNVGGLDLIFRCSVGVILSLGVGLVDVLFLVLFLFNFFMPKRILGDFSEISLFMELILVYFYYRLQ